MLRLLYPKTFPNAVLTPEAAYGTDNISSVVVIAGGSGYTAPTITAIDPVGTGSGATFSATLSGGVITGISVLTEGQNYAGGTYLQITDSTGSGAVGAPQITNIVTFRTSASVFSSGNVGDVIKIGNNNASLLPSTGIAASGGGKAVITSYISGTEVEADIVEPITNTLLNNPISIYQCQLIRVNGQ